MTFVPVLPAKKALNKAYLKKPVERAELERFRAALNRLFDSLDEGESEEHCKNLFAEFLREAFYRERNAINTKASIDLAIYADRQGGGKPQVLFEVKRPANASEMFGNDNPNAKSLHELILYHLRERFGADNLELRHLAITNIKTIHLFDARDFEEAFAKDRGLKKAWEDIDRGAGLALGTGDFYASIAKPFVASHEGCLDYVTIDLESLDRASRRPDFDEAELIPAWKLLSPAHLLKEPFQNDSNSLDTGFYAELLHLMGLAERKEGSKTLIGRRAEGERVPGSLVELAIEKLELRDLLDRLPEPERYGAGAEERRFGVALELVLLWVNRLLFMKLLEAQMVEQHRGDEAWRFLTTETVPDFDALENLFFGVLAKKPNERPGRLREAFARVPYLNSSLFEASALEGLLSISGLDSRLPLPLSARTVLKASDGSRRNGSLPTLDYLFNFLDAYDFSSDSEGAVVERGRSLINASVLGLIFEKINGYKEGSFFTPGYITQFMACKTVEAAVLRKFSGARGREYGDLASLANDLDSSAASILAANAVMDGLRVIDPAVGSGHFLVSVLNEIVAIKSELGILADRSGRRPKGWRAQVENDELFLVDEDGNFAAYLQPFADNERQRLREILFEEKRRVIENCLFGVDLNRNSVQICKLRLWIELLKSSYYTAESGFAELETLPNIDINIRRGNSLVARYPLDMDLAGPLRKKGWKIDHWLNAVRAYQNAKTKDEKRAAEAVLAEMRLALAGVARDATPDRMRLGVLRGELAHLEAPDLIAREAPEPKTEARIAKLRADIEATDERLADDEHNPIFRDAFEWRLEFPEVLDDKGRFIGFDAVIGNPPYIRQEELAAFKPHFRERYSAFEGTADIYTYFFERSLGILREGGVFRFIVSNSFFKANFGKGLRRYLAGTGYLRSIIDFGGKAVFESAKDTYVCIPAFEKSVSAAPLIICKADHFEETEDRLDSIVATTSFTADRSRFGMEPWTFDDETSAAVFQKCLRAGMGLGEYVNGAFYRGITSGLNEAFIIDKEEAEALSATNAESRCFLHRVLGGQEIRTWTTKNKGQWIIAIPNGTSWSDRKKPKPTEGEARRMMESQVPAIMQHLAKFSAALERRQDQGDYWWELRPCDYYDVLARPKIVFPDICKNPRFHLDLDGHYLTNTAYAIGSSEPYLLGILNSRLFWFLIGKISIPFGERAGEYRYRLIYQYMEQIPIVERRVAESDPGRAHLPPAIESLVSSILAAKKADSAADVGAMEAEIDALVYGLYGLTEEEVAIVEGRH
ncbi:MAG TPA: Eco57I restriction-modification methylase domain-containing protein [Rectinemataceae bacterium]|nr:Eco57I restriction-modification methylase domain-containing protein [Rectinemataceae bacterium]